MSILGTLKVMLTADSGKFSQDMKSGQKAVSGFKSEIASMAKGLLAVAAPAAVFGAISKFAKDGVNEFVAYNKTVRETSEATGMTAEAVSRLIQVGDDWGIQSENITSAMKMMTKNGLQPSIENLAKLADEFVNTTDKTAFAEKAAKLLGRNWSSLIPILKDGGQALRDQTDAVSDGLLATDESIRKARAYEVAMDNLGDMTTELKYLFADQLLPSIIAVTNATASLGFATLGLSSAAKQGKITWGEYLEQSAKVTWTSYTAADAQKWLSNELSEQRGEVKNSIGPIDGLIQRQKDLAMYTDDSAEANGRFAMSITEVSRTSAAKEAIDVLTTAYKDGTIAQDVYNVKMSDLMRNWLGMPESQVTASIALQNIKQDLDNGKISALEASSAILGVGSAADAINGKNANVTVTTTYQEIGRPANPRDTVSPRRRAGGGPVSAGSAYLVGERGMETFVPSQNGTIINNYNTNAMMKNSNADIIAAINASKINEAKLARMIRDAVLKVV